MASRTDIALDDSPTTRTPPGRWYSFRQFLVDGVLWMLGGLGLISLLAALAAHFFGFTIVLFSTGSMTPTIPAGSAALVRLVPAATLAVGDITTIERTAPLLPITHRITSVKTVEGQPETRIVTMRGDANKDEDPEPYTITQARIVIGSVPGIANMFKDLRNPLLMGGLTLLAGGLVMWAFWPRAARNATMVAAAAVVAASPVLGATDAQAAQSERQIVGQHMVLTVISDEEAMSSMLPGLPVFWQVGVNTIADEEGAVHVGLSLLPGMVEADALSVDVQACPERWQGDTCAGIAHTWVAATPLDGAFLPATHQDSRELGSTPAGTPIWVLVRATLTRAEPDIRATLKVAAWGSGEVVEAVSDNGGGNGAKPGEDGLAFTGSGGALATLGLGGAAIASGLLVARLAGARRRKADDEPTL